MTKSSYRQDLQGLRAVAIILVLLFHFKIGNMSGGFAGVDVFFVLSGYLMTGLLLNKSGQKIAPVLKSFYWKRVWRIAPAYLATLVLVLGVAWFVLLPFDLKKLGESSLFSVLFTTNFYYSNSAGYFDTDAIFKPLLHTWSLAVEMQFYVFWPLVILFLNRARPVLQVLIIALLTVISFVGAIWLGATDPDVAFYALPFRVWEFGLGGLIAHPLVFTWLSRWQKPVRWVQLPALVSLLITGLVFDNSLMWPAPYGLLPTVATAVLILGGAQRQGGISVRLLSLFPIVWLGEISYSLYLVHWPVVTMIHMLWWPESSLALRLFAMLACIPLAWLLYQFIERPLREIGRDPKINYLKMVPGSTVSLLVVAFGFFAIQTKGFPQRYPEAIATKLIENREVMKKRNKCSLVRGPNGYVKCDYAGRPKNALPSVVLWGDSHSGPWFVGLSDVAQKSDRVLGFKTFGGCPPIGGVTRRPSRLIPNNRCLKHNNDTLALITSQEQIKTVILAARWAYYAETTRFGLETGTRGFIVSPGKETLSVENSKHILANKLDETIAALLAAKKRVIIIKQVPEQGYDVPRCWKMRIVRNQSPKTCAIRREEVMKRQAYADKVLTDLKSRYPTIQLYDPKDWLCDQKTCQAIFNGKPGYKDDDHILTKTAKSILKELTISLGD
jgi:peptidoglycan/LPS O-acetylase OafA/YrhL